MCVTRASDRREKGLRENSPKEKKRYVGKCSAQKVLFSKWFQRRTFSGSCFKRREFYVSLSRFPLWGSEDDVWGWAKKRKETDIFEKGEREKFNSLFSPPTIPKLGGNLFSLFFQSLFRPLFLGKHGSSSSQNVVFLFFPRSQAKVLFRISAFSVAADNCNNPTQTGLTPWEES